MPFVIHDFASDRQTLRERVRRRAESGNDASEAGVAALRAQFNPAEPLAEDECGQILTYDVGDPADGWVALKRRVATVGGPVTGPCR